MAGVFGRSKTHPYILAELGNESRGKKPVIGTTGRKRVAREPSWGENETKSQNHFILKPIKSTL